MAITRWSGGPPGENMAGEILVDLAGLVGRHPWWRARADLTLALLGRLGVRPPARVLDAGCGWGVTLGRLERRGLPGRGAGHLAAPPWSGSTAPAGSWSRPT